MSVPSQACCSPYKAGVSSVFFCSIAIEWPKGFKEKLGLYKSISDRLV